ncbi:MAG: outer membrane homotrimeric porin [Desulfovibrio sp.]|nr:outer membrane homotrimeric porin [Desulfovibrio sp.]
MKKIYTVILAAAMVLGAASAASAIDFKAKGQWLVGFEAGENSLLSKQSGQKSNHNDNFAAQQRVRLQLDAVASEALSGTVFFEIGDQVWGQSRSGGALGADGTVVEVKNAYIDWIVPHSDLRFRMGLQSVTLPNTAGGSAVMDTDAAAIAASYQFSENVGLTGLWFRPVNDNFAGYRKHGIDNYRQNYLDNMDLFAVTMPLKFHGMEATPWVMYGIRGKNALQNYNSDDSDVSWTTTEGNLTQSLLPYPAAIGNTYSRSATDKTYGSLFWAGLPLSLTFWDPLNIELDINYGYAEKMGRYDVTSTNGDVKRGSTKREGWLAKALVEYRMDWGVPGVFAWYASGDDGTVRNGSERMPSIAPDADFTSFMGDGNYGWGWVDYALDYSGTWGLGAQVRDMSFMEDLSHTLRLAWWGGTNSPSMIKYMGSATAWNAGWGNGTSPYLTTKDGLLEVNLVNSYQMYENFNINFELGYIANFMDNDAWRKRSGNNSSFEKQDAWKAQLIFAYSF